MMCWQALLLTYGCFFAEFLEDLSLVRLGLLDLTTCVGFRYGLNLFNLRSFSWKRAPQNFMHLTQARCFTRHKLRIKNECTNKIQNLFWFSYSCHSHEFVISVALHRTSVRCTIFSILGFVVSGFSWAPPSYKERKSNNTLCVQHSVPSSKQI